METPKLLGQNAFFIEDPDEPGKMGIPVVMFQGEHITLTNIRDDKIDFFKKIVGSIAKQAGTKAYFAEYETPTSVVEIEPVEIPGTKGFFVSRSGQAELGDMLEQMTDLVDKLVSKRGHKSSDKKTDEEIVH